MLCNYQEVRREYIRDCYRKNLTEERIQKYKAVFREIGDEVGEVNVEVKNDSYSAPKSKPRQILDFLGENEKATTEQLQKEGIKNFCRNWTSPLHKLHKLHLSSRDVDSKIIEISQSFTNKLDPQ